MSGPFASLNGQRVISARVTFPYYGAWVGDVVLAASDAIPAQTTLVVGDLSLTCAVIRIASFSGARSAQIVGGFGGWRKRIGAQAYQNNAGIKRSLILGDAAASVGEKVTVSQDQTIGTFFVREAAPAARVLRQLSGSVWWMDASGVSQVGPRVAGAITTAFTVVNWSGGKGSFEIATEALSDWMPGRSFTSPTVTTSQTIGLTQLDVNNDGKLRLTVLNAAA